MSKNQLEDIRDRYMEYEYDFNLKKKDVDWLIEQAEKLHGKKGRYGYKDMYKICNGDYAELRYRSDKFKGRIEELEDAYDKQTFIHEQLNKDYVKVREENKRLRDLLEQVCQAEDMADIWDIEDYYRALEGEEYENRNKITSL